MDLKLLLFVQDGISKQKYLDALTASGAQVFVTSSFQDLSDEICKHSFHGLFLDVPTKMKALKENKSYVYNLIQRFPVSHLQYNDETGEVRCFHYNKTLDSPLLDFINTQCKNFPPQRIRENIRKIVHLHLLVYKYKESKKPERSVTKDISCAGCFIISTGRWKEGDDVWLHFVQMTDLHPIEGQIQTVIRWGENGRIPGIGVKFKCLSPSQSKELNKILYQS